MASCGFCGSNTHECNEAVLVYHDHSAMHTRNCSYDTHARWLKLLARLPWSCDLHSEPSSIISGFMDKSAAAQTFLMTITVVLVSYGIYIDQGRVMHKSTLDYDLIVYKPIAIRRFLYKVPRVSKCYQSDNKQNGDHSKTQSAMVDDAEGNVQNIEEGLIEAGFILMQVSTAVSSTQPCSPEGSLAQSSSTVVSCPEMCQLCGSAPPNYFTQIYVCQTCGINSLRAPAESSNQLTSPYDLTTESHPVLGTGAAEQSGVQRPSAQEPALSVACAFTNEGGVTFSGSGSTYDASASPDDATECDGCRANAPILKCISCSGQYCRDCSYTLQCEDFPSLSHVHVTYPMLWQQDFVPCTRCVDPYGWEVQCSNCGGRFCDGCYKALNCDARYAQYRASRWSDQVANSSYMSSSSHQPPPSGRSEPSASLPNLVVIALTGTVLAASTVILADL